MTDGGRRRLLLEASEEDHNWLTDLLNHLIPATDQSAKWIEMAGQEIYKENPPRESVVYDIRTVITSSSHLPMDFGRVGWLPSHNAWVVSSRMLAGNWSKWTPHPLLVRSSFRTRRRSSSSCCAVCLEGRIGVGFGCTTVSSCEW